MSVRLALDDLRGKTVGLDTAPLIFYIEDHPTYADLLAPFFEAVTPRCSLPQKALSVV
jgi:hypothetical protein